MPDKKMPYYNRELSWMDFNARVLEEAAKKENPLMERLRFLAITGSNLDEFFMVRVAGVKAQVNSNYKVKNNFDLSPQELLPLLEEKTHKFMEKQYSCLHRSIAPVLARHGIRFVTCEEMTPPAAGVRLPVLQAHPLPCAHPPGGGRQPALPAARQQDAEHRRVPQGERGQEGRQRGGEELRHRPGALHPPPVLGAAHQRGPGLHPAGGHHHL